MEKKKSVSLDTTLSKEAKQMLEELAIRVFERKKGSIKKVLEIAIEKTHEDLEKGKISKKDFGSLEYGT